MPACEIDRKKGSKSKPLSHDGDIRRYVVRPSKEIARRTRASRKMKQPPLDSDDHNKGEQELDADVDDIDDEDQEPASTIAIRGKGHHTKKMTQPANRKASRGTAKQIKKSPPSDSQSGDL